MGTKRVGWARIRSLINENENQLGPRRAKVRSVVTADVTLTAADYGKVILLSGAAALNLELVLPADPPVGAELKFILVAASHANSELLLDSGTSHTINGYAVMYKADMEDGTVAFHSHRKLGWGDAAAKGGCLHLVCSSSKHWMIVDAKSSVAWINAHT
tara:strand:- start:767 stop:1243 length:477 start_codon:yes stop_codon:yes gene_type:complete